MTDAQTTLAVPPEAVAVRLYRIVRGEPVACEAMRFAAGDAGVDLVLRRAKVSGRVEIEGPISDHFADLLDADGDMVATVALDAGSYRALKTRWMRTKVEKLDA